MFQAIHYDFESRTYFLRDDETGWTNFQYSPTFYKIDKNGDFITLDGFRVSPTKKYDKENPNLYEKDIDKELLILRDLYYKTDNLPKSHNIVYLDIEIEIGGTLTPQYVKDTPTKLTAIALIDNNSKNKICFILDEEDQIGDINVEGKEIITCSSEVDLINKFIRKWKELDPTIVVGYNSDFFDIPYLYYRIRNILGCDVANQLSPIGKIKETPWKPDSPITIGGVSSLDYMLLHKKFIVKEEPSYKLNAIGLKYADLGKIEDSRSLDRLFKEDVNKFIDYNIRDVEIIVALEENLQFIALSVLICHLCHTPYEMIYFNTLLNEGAILTYLKRKGIVPNNKPHTINRFIRDFIVGDYVKVGDTTEGILVSHEGKECGVQLKSGIVKYYSESIVKKYDPSAGGYLKDPIPGLYEDLSDLDFTSLYPSIIKMLNAGLETCIGRIQTKDNYEQNNTLEELKQKDQSIQVVVEKLDRKTYKLKEARLTIGELVRFIEDNNITIGASGAMFSTNKKSIACEVLEDWFDKREYYRDLMKKAGKEGDKAGAKLYKNYQQAFKILQNAMYGTFGVNTWRFADGYKMISSAITNTGQRLTMGSIEYVNEIINKELGTEKDYIVASDTDSLYIEINPLLKKRFPKITERDERIEKIIAISQEIQERANQQLNHPVKKYFNAKENKYLTLKQEVVVERAYWAGKRRYAMWVVNDQGVPKDEFDIKGLDIMKSNMNPIYKEFAESFLKDILFGKKKHEMDEKLINFKKTVKTLPISSIARPTGVNKVTEYIERRPTAGSIFSTIAKGTPINSRSVIYYNDLIKFKGLSKKHSMIVRGDKIKFIALLDNPYKIDVIAFTGEDPDFINEFIDKYANREEGFNTSLLNKLTDLYANIKWDFPSFNENVGKFFKF